GDAVEQYLLAATQVLDALGQRAVLLGDLEDAGVAIDTELVRGPGIAAHHAPAGNGRQGVLEGADERVGAVRGPGEVQPLAAPVIARATGAGVQAPPQIQE